MREILNKSRIFTYRKEGEGFKPILVHQNVVLNGQNISESNPKYKLVSKCLDDKHNYISNDRCCAKRSVSLLL